MVRFFHSRSVSRALIRHTSFEANGRTIPIKRQGGRYRSGWNAANRNAAKRFVRLLKKLSNHHGSGVYQIDRSVFLLMWLYV